MSRQFQKQPVLVVHETNTLISPNNQETENHNNSGKRGGFMKSNNRKKSQTNIESSSVTKPYRSPGNSANINHGVTNVNTNLSLSKVNIIKQMVHLLNE